MAADIPPGEPGPAEGALKSPVDATLSARLYALWRRLSGRPLPVCDRCGVPVAGGCWFSMDTPVRYWHPECGPRESP